MNCVTEKRASLIKNIWNLILIFTVYINFKDRGYIEIILNKLIKGINYLNKNL